jgi:hypothetical protein
MSHCRPAVIAIPTAKVVMSGTTLDSVFALDDPMRWLMTTAVIDKKAPTIRAVGTWRLSPRRNSLLTAPATTTQARGLQRRRAAKGTGPGMPTNYPPG